MTTLIGKTAIVTGGSRGIGLAIARALVTNDVNVMITGTKEKPLEDAMRELGAMAMAQRADVRDYADVERAFNAAAAHFGGVDILVNNAVVRHFSPVENFPPEKWDEALAVNLSAPFHLIRLALPGMKTRGWGRIINLASIAGRGLSANSSSAYAAAKGGIIAFTRKLAHELGPDGINVNAIAPSITLTERIRPHWEKRSQGSQAEEIERTPLRRVAEAVDQANVICFLASADADFVTGLTIDVTGGV